MARPEKMPEVVFIGPPKRRAQFKYVLFQIRRRDGRGIPVDLTLLGETDTINLQGGEDFMTAYVPVQMTRPREARRKGDR